MTGGPGDGARAREPRTIATADGLHLEAELAIADAPRAAVVLCHPHPQFGGTMRSIVVGALFDALPASGVTCLRFNFRGVEGSEGAYGDGRDERLDVEAAVATLAAAVPEEIPILVVGWSFGADMALSVLDPRLAAWVAIACPLRFSDAVHAAGADPRPKWLVLAEHDEFQDPALVRERVGSWTATQVVVVAGASHFFVGRTDKVVDAVRDAIDAVTHGR